MIKIDKNLEDFQYEEALKKYAELYNLKKSKGKNEREFADTNKMYVIYARKSTEDEKRQVQSIEDQIGHCKVYAHNNNLHVVEIIREEKSAKTAGKRAQFNTMIETIKRGDSYNSILAWHPDRLARNMKESGEIMDLVDNQIIVDLKFSSYTYNNDAGGKLTLSILFAMAKEFSDKLSEDTKRGNHKKISEGKYIGTQKKGYIPNRDDFFRKDANTFEIYRTTWDMYGKGATQTSILKYLADNDIDMSENAISLFFQDPFYAGFYSYGTQIVDLKKVDPSFTPMVAPRDFINVQKINRDNPRGWKRSVGFRPFEHFMMCADCGRPMTPAFSTGRGGRYLKVSCGSQECKEIRRKNQIKPVTNTINAGVILDFAIKFIEEIKDQIDVKIYNNAKEKFMYGRDLNTKNIKEEISVLKGKKTKLEVKVEKLSERLPIEANPEVANKLSNDLQILLKEGSLIEKEIRKFEEEYAKSEYEAEVIFPPFEEFLNFFQNIGLVLRTTNDAYLMDQLIKLVFLNLEVKDKKVHLYSLREPFDTFRNLKFTNGVADGT